MYTGRPHSINRNIVMLREMHVLEAQINHLVYSPASQKILTHLVTVNIKRSVFSDHGIIRDVMFKCMDTKVCCALYV